LYFKAATNSEIFSFFAWETIAGILGGLMRYSAWFALQKRKSGNIYNEICHLATFNYTVQQN
jgi:hypothetical protein